MSLAPTLRLRAPRPAAPAPGPVRRIDPLDDPAWDAKLAHCPGASFFHGAGWARVLRDTYGYRPVYFVHEAGRTLRGILAFLEIDSWITGRRGVSLPFTDECQPVAAGPGELHQLMRAARVFAAARQWDYWEIRGGPARFGAPAALTFHGHEVPLVADPAANFARCESAVRRAIRRAERSALTIQFAQSLDAMRAFHALLCQTRRRHGLPPQPLAFFENIQRHVLAPQHGCIVLARLGGRPVAGAVFFHFDGTAIFKFGASDESFQHLRPNNLVLWRAIEWHGRAGFRALDLGRTSLGNHGLRHFKLGWGAVERRIEYARFDCRAAAFVTARDRSSGWHSGMFKLVPPRLARLIGALAYKHVA